MESIPVDNSLIECNSNTPYKRRKQTNQALEALGQLFKDSFIDDLDNNKLNKNDILSLTLSRLLREKYWPSHFLNSKFNSTNKLNNSYMFKYRKCSVSSWYAKFIN